MQHSTRYSAPTAPFRLIIHCAGVVYLLPDWLTAMRPPCRLPFHKYYLWHPAGLSPGIHSFHSSHSRHRTYNIETWTTRSISMGCVCMNCIGEIADWVKWNRLILPSLDSSGVRRHPRLDRSPFVIGC